MKRILQALIGIILLLSTGAVKATDSLYARRLVDTLSSPLFWGRGYTNQGMRKAATFIAGEMKAAGLQPVGKAFQQSFAYPVNVFEGDMQLSLNGQKLLPGRHFVVGNESHSTAATGVLQQADSVTWINAQQRVIINLVDKLTWDVAQHQADYTSFRVLKSVLANPPQQFEAKVDARLMKSFEATNVLGRVEGTVRPDSFLVFTAHYDHLGGMGRQTYFPGANDNASGIALLLTLARHFAKNPPRYSVVFMAFAGEEAGLVGSEYFVNHPLFPLGSIRFLTNLDLMGNGEEGVTVVNATEFPKEFDLLRQISSDNNLLTAVTPRGKARNSDHYWFTEKGVPSFFIYTLGHRKDYHDIGDVAATLPLFEINDLQQLLTKFADALCR